jgi:hypothetical protein
MDRKLNINLDNLKDEKTTKVLNKIERKKIEERKTERKERGIQNSNASHKSKKEQAQVSYNKKLKVVKDKLGKKDLSIYNKKERKIIIRLGKKAGLLEDALNEALAKPEKNESKQDFVSRFMSSELAVKEFPDNKQRLAVAYSQWERKDKLEEGFYLISYEKNGSKIKSEIEANDEDDAVIKAIDKFDIESDNITRVKEVTRIPLGENNNRSKLSRPYRNHSEFAQDLEAMYGQALKLTGEDKEKYESAKKYLSEDDVYRLAEKYNVGKRHIEMIFEDLKDVIKEKNKVNLKEDTLMKHISENNLFDNIRAKQKRIAKGSGETMKKPGEKGYPDNLKKIAKEAEAEEKLNEDFLVFLREDLNEEEKLILENFILNEEKKQKSSFLFFLLKFIPEKRLNALIQKIYDSSSSKLSEPSEKEKLKKMLDIEGKNKKEKIALIKSLLNQAPEEELIKAGEKSVNFLKSKVKDKEFKQQISEDVLFEEFAPQEKQEQIQTLQRNVGMVSSLVGVSPIILMSTTALGSIFGVYLFLIPVVFNLIMSRVMPKLIENIKKK